ncbi:MAG: [acyl-carrier-protein] S-malonyltransferase [Calditrichaeota bacterium]|nr:MAG: [acyl-carrier-protein] S-malonyltransferase [Calditrichota bacterium]
MSKLAFLFPGQGSQFVGMGQDLYDTFQEVKELFDEAESILQFPLKKICFEGPEEELKQTRYTQPAIFVHSIAVDLLLKKQGVTPSATAGHSLGEYSALVSAGALSFEDGLRLVKIRAELMQQSGEVHPGTMAAIIGLEPEAVSQACQEASDVGIVQPANFNCPGQIVISGEKSAVHRAMEIAKSKGARLVKELVVSGAFHSPLMANALNGLVKALKEAPIKEANIPVYSNVKAQPVQEPDKIRSLLEKQLLAPVLWENIIRNMITDGIDTFYEVGPGNVLTGLLRRIDRSHLCTPVGTKANLEDLSNE